MNLGRAPKTTKGQKTRERVLAEARLIIVGQGFDTLAMRDLAKRCEIQLGNLQYYFATREAVAVAVITAEAEGDIGAVYAAVEEHEDPKEALAAIARTLVTRWRGDSGLIYATLIYLSLHSPEFSALKKQIYATFYQSLEAVTRALDGKATPAEVKQRVRLITALIDGSVLQMVERPKTLIEAVTSAVIDIAGGGLRYGS